ncbi:type II toxin-antitoxin system ParD family antitoxin [Nitrosomonas sp.]|uniref:type II toxin-antitoxin system ParD family antitoxin n=1 Tax=Nitrosomonas sp. TaxID=42353 RepID=UPI0025E805DC|nr:type II toxin-antitoxin system ParD family antitoxin [Nitrosomonas sp.]
MHISLTPELENIIKEKVASGLYNNASEVIREALRFMETNEELIYHLKLNSLRAKLAEGEADFEAGLYTELGKEDIDSFFRKGKNKALNRIKQESQ